MCHIPNIVYLKAKLIVWFLQQKIGYSMNKNKSGAIKLKFVFHCNQTKKEYVPSFQAEFLWVKERCENLVMLCNFKNKKIIFSVLE